MKKLIILALCFGLGLFLVRQVFPRIETIIETHYDTTFVTKTIEVPIERIVYRHLPAKIETLLIGGDNVIHRQLIAHIDTLIKNDTISVAYYFPPANFFNINLRPAPRLIEYRDNYVLKTVEIEKKDFLGGYPEKILYFVAGYGASTLIGRMK